MRQRSRHGSKEAAQNAHFLLACHDAVTASNMCGQVSMLPLRATCLRGSMETQLWPLIPSLEGPHDGRKLGSPAAQVQAPGEHLAIACSRAWLQQVHKTGPTLSKAGLSVGSGQRALIGEHPWAVTSSLMWAPACCTHVTSRCLLHLPHAAHL